jgi:hypothetical protein
VVDYRKLNTQTIPINFPIPRINEYLQELGGSVIFSQIDMNMGYYQIPIREFDVYKTAFSLDMNHYEFTRMPFGLSNAPRTFQMAMNNMFNNIPYIKIYLDDLLIHSKSEKEHYEHLKEVLTILKNNNISINFNKTNIWKKEVTYLGHIISKDGVKADVSRVSKFKGFIPKSKKHVQKILGVINWYRPYLKDLSKEISTISNIIKKETTFKWNEENSKTLELILNKISEQTLLNYPEFNKPFILEKDASDIGIGAVLRQEHKIIGFYSYKLSKSELNYSIVEK